MADTTGITPHTPQQWCGIIADFLQDNPGAWCQGSMALTADGHACDSDDPGAVRWCTLGLLDKFACASEMVSRCAKLLSRAVTPYGDVLPPPRSPIAFNDACGRTVEEIISMFRCASYMPDVAGYVVPVEKPKKDCGEEPVLYGFGEAAKLSEATLSEVVHDAKAAVIPNWSSLAELPPVKGSGDNDINPLKLDESRLAGADVEKMKNWVKVQWGISKFIKTLARAA